MVACERGESVKKMKWRINGFGMFEKVELRELQKKQEELLKKLEG